MRIEEAAARRQAHIDSGKETIVGVNWPVDSVERGHTLAPQN
jgi:methylmalonyl-CoA mutase N-terminal domain/subunit